MRRLREAAAVPRSRTEVRRVSRRLLDEGRQSAGADPLKDRVSVLMTFKVRNNDRAAILETVLDRVAGDLRGADIPVRIADASPARYAPSIRARAEALSADVDYRELDLPMTLGFSELLGSCSTRHCYLQFDDQLTTNLSTGFLTAASKLLDRYPALPAITAVWPLEVGVDETAREVRVVTHGERRDGTDGSASYRFAESKGRRRPLVVEEIDGYRFGIFENFYYGFAFFHIVTRTDDYRRRLRWYLDNLGTTSAHDIEIAAAHRTLGPFWTHLAVCLDGTAVLDLDYSHTESSVRPHSSTAREVFGALGRGFRIVASGTDA